MEPLFDPEHLRDREDVPFIEETTAVDPTEFETLRETVDSHVVVGLTNDEGEVLLTDDGSHGWTLPAFPVEPGEDVDWAATGRRGVEDVTGVAIELARPERVRRVEFHPDGEPDRRFRMYTVIVRASSVTGRPIGNEPDADIRASGWFSEVPDEQTGAVADDIRRFVA